jgi:ribose 5-phosphate isomerase A
MKPPSNSQNHAKEAAARKAVEFVENGMIVGLGTGSTAAFFISHLIDRCRKNLKIQVIGTSTHSLELARIGGLAIADIDKITTIDLTIDGADEIDPLKRMIKGGGGALLREKIIASISREMVVVVDESKLVKQLGAHPLPVEVVPFAHHAIQRKLENLGYKGVFRLQKEGQLFLTDNNNFIIDLHLNKLKDPEAVDKEIRSIPGVVETGLFLNLAGRVIVGYEDGSTKTLTTNL